MTTVHSSSNDDVTIVMITHNRCDEITRSLVEHQALPEQPCIIVVDNASTDDTVSIVRTKFPDVTVIQAKKNLGAAGLGPKGQEVRARSRRSGHPAHLATRNSLAAESVHPRRAARHAS